MMMMTITHSRARTSTRAHTHARNEYKISVTKLDGKLTGRHSHKRNINFKNKTDLRETGSGVVDWINLSQDRNQYPASVNMTVNVCIP
jgi:hypothetical protein